MTPEDWLDYPVFDNTLLAWVTAFGVFAIAWLLLGMARRLAATRLASLAEKRRVMVLHVASRAVASTRAWFLFLVALFLASRVPELSVKADAAVVTTVTVALLLQMGLWATAALAAGLSLRRERQLASDPGAVAAMDVLGFVLRLVVWSLVLLLALDNLGINITALIAGLGIGGVAVALATQNILGDLFASLSIMLDRPFVVGDFLIVDDYLGNVEKIGIKTTRLRSLSGEQLVFSNNDLLNSRLRNYGRMYERRVVFSLGVTYQTPPEKLRLIPDIARKAIEAERPVRFDRAHFQKYGDFALVFEMVYYVLSPDYNLYMDIQQNINLAILERFREEGIEFAYPTQTLFVSSQEGGVSSSAKKA